MQSKAKRKMTRKEFNILLEARFSFVQRIFVLCSTGSACLYIAVSLFFMDRTTFGTGMMLFFFTAYLIIFILIHLDRGFLNKNGMLFRISGIFDLTFFKSEIKLEKWNKVGILKQKKFIKFPFISIARPDWGKTYWFYEVHLLNEKHTEKHLLLRLTTIENAEEAVDFLETHFNLQFEEYNPDFV